MGQGRLRVKDMKRARELRNYCGSNMKYLLSDVVDCLSNIFTCDFYIRNVVEVVPSMLYSGFD
jgi:hypothetical protein